jgi:hypothetical protein
MGHGGCVLHSKRYEPSIPTACHCWADMSAITPLRCQTCGAELSGRAVCYHCGTLVALEFGLARIQMRARQLFDDKINSFIPRRLAPHHFLWICAIMPFAVVPPFISFAWAIVSMRRRREGERSEEATEWIAIISLLNIILSVAFLYKFHFSPSELIAYVKDYLFNTGVRLSPSTDHPSVRLTPI